MSFQRALSVEEICQKLRPILGEKIDRIYLSYATADSREGKEEVESMVNALYQKYFDQLLSQQVLLPPPQDGILNAEYNIGEITYGKRKVGSFGLREQDFPRHICITGMSGSGKTTIACNILDQLIAHNKPFLVFDWKKSFRPIMAQDNKLTCFTIGDKAVTNNCKVNINRPPKGVSPKEWIGVLCDLIAESFFVSYGVHKILLETLNEAFEAWGIYKGSENYPTWHHIKHKLEEKMDEAKSREQGWIESALRVATVLTFGDFGEVVNYKGENAVAIEDLLNKRVIFELNALGSIEKKFFSEFVLSYIYKLKKAQANSAKRGFEYAILVDEAHNIFLKNKTNFAAESVTDMVYREMREYGVSLICLDQHISKLSDTVAGNSACHIAFQQQLPEDIESISRLMHMTDHKNHFSNLTVGTGVVKLADRYTEPFSISVPWNTTRENEVGDELVKERAQRFLLKTEVENETDPQFNYEAQHAKPVELNGLFNKIRLPQALKLHAVAGIEQTHSQSGMPNSNETPTHELEATIHATVQRRLSQGEELGAIEKELEYIYNPIAVNNVITRIMQEELHKKPVIQQPEYKSSSSEEQYKRIKEIQKEEEMQRGIQQKRESYALAASYQIKQTQPVNQSKEETPQERFLTYLQENPGHELTTVNLYKQLGFSPRKGNNIKNELVNQGKIRVEEIKDEKGWRKLIRLA